MVSDLIVAPESLMRGFFRTPTGPGWALVGDACHFKHPGTAQGIGDAVEQAIYLAEFAIGRQPEPRVLRRLARQARLRALRVVLHVGAVPAARVRELVQGLGKRGRRRPGPSRLLQPPCGAVSGDQQERLARWFADDDQGLERTGDGCPRPKRLLGVSLSQLSHRLPLAPCREATLVIVLGDTQRCACRRTPVAAGDRRRRRA